MLTAKFVDDNVRTLDVMKPIELVEGCVRVEAHYMDE